MVSFIDRPLRDRLNAAISGGVARNLDRELDYLIPRTYLSVSQVIAATDTIFAMQECKTC